jgi:hypothetical protein
VWDCTTEEERNVRGFNPKNTTFSTSSVVDPAWLSSVLGVEIASAEQVLATGTGGLTAEVKRVRVTSTRGETTNLVLKELEEKKYPLSLRLGLYREATFFHRFGQNMGTEIPWVVYALGNSETGQKVVLMEDVGAGLQTGLFFGPGSPLNWGKDLDKITKSIPNPPTGEDVAREAFMMAARLHAKFWKSPELKEQTWLRGSVWEEKAWRAAQNQSAEAWVKCKSKEICPGLQWDPELVAIVDASLALGTDWDLFVTEHKKRAFTLVHGDFHPANMMWLKHANPKRPLVVLDWELVGVGSGPQDLAQYLISHMNPAVRRECEERLVRAYFEKIQSLGVVDYNWESCWKDYVSGGSGRWVWFVPVLADMCPEPMVQYFNDQTLAFLRDHGVTPANVGAPRV